MGNLVEEYRNLEMKLLNKLRTKIENSTYESNYINDKAIQVNINDKVELVIIDDQIIFIDDRGLYQCIFNESLEDLILHFHSI